MSFTQTNEAILVKEYNDLITLHLTLQNTELSIHRSSTTSTSLETSNFHTFFLPHLPLLLTTQKQHAIYNLRKAFIYVSHLSSFEDHVVETRYANFGKSLVWALDHLDHLLCHIQETDELEIVKAIKTVFRLVASLCCREWGIDDPTSDQPQNNARMNFNDVVRFGEDPVYYPPSRMRTTSTPHPINMINVFGQVNHAYPDGNNDDKIVPTFLPHHTDDMCNSGASVSPIQSLSMFPFSNVPPSDQAIQVEEFGSNTQTGVADLLSHNSIYIRNHGKHILPDACIKETTKGCHVPFELTIQEDSQNGVYGLSDSPTCGVRASYPDQTCFSYIPVQGIRVLNSNTTHTIENRDKLCTLSSIELGTEVYKTLVEGLEQAYMTRFPGGSFPFVTDKETQNADADSRIRIIVPMLTDCFVRVVDLLCFVERPIRETLEMCQHDLFGIGLLKVEFVPVLDNTKIVISLAGVIVERSLLNYGDRIFQLMDSSVVCELEQ